MASVTHDCGSVAPSLTISPGRVSASAWTPTGRTHPDGYSYAGISLICDAAAATVTFSGEAAVVADGSFTAATEPAIVTISAECTLHIEPFASTGATVTVEGSFSLPVIIDCSSAPAIVDVLIETRPNKRIYIVDQEQHAIFIMRQDGAMMRTFGGYGTSSGRFSSPYGIAEDGEHLYVTDQGNGRVQKFTFEGDYVAQFGTNGNAAGELSGPTGIAATSRFVFVADTGNNRVSVFSHEGVYKYSITGLAQPTDIWTDETHLHIYNEGNGTIHSHMLSVIGYGAWANLIIPELTAEITMRQVHELAATLPDIEASMFGSTGSMLLSLDAELPLLELDLRTGHRLTLEIPLIEMSATGHAGIAGSLDRLLPAIEAAFTGTIHQGGSLIIDLPAITMSLTGGQNQSGLILNLTLPAWEIGINDPWTGTTGIIAEPATDVRWMGFGEFTITATISTGTVGNLAATLPDLEFEGTAIWIAGLSVATPATGTKPTAVVYNMQTGAVSEYSSHIFNSVTKVGDKYLATDGAAIYELTGAVDDSSAGAPANIAAFFQTRTQDIFAPDDKGNAGVARIRESKFVLRNDGVLTLTVVEDETTTRTYSIDTVNSTIHEERVKYERGLKGRHYAHRVDNVAGAYFDIENFRVFAEQVTHRRR